MAIAINYRSQKKIQERKLRSTRLHSVARADAGKKTIFLTFANIE